MGDRMEDPAMADPSKVDVDFEGRVAIVTGAGGGLGRSHALLLAERGARVVVNDVGGTRDGTGASASPADAVVKEILDRGGEAVASYDSVATAEGGQAIVRTALDAFGTVDAVVNNAGILRDKSVANMAPEDFEAVVDVHLLGAFHVSQPAFRVMKEKGFGRFVHTSSGSGLFGNFGQANYAAAKAGIVGLSHVLSIEGARYGITSNAIAPAARTRLTEGLIGDIAEVLTPELVSPLVAYLASPACTVSHEVFSVGGGRVARVFTGLTPGWFAGKGATMTPEDVAAHLDRILATDGFVVPQGFADEMALLVKELGS
jgi:NAD(P)-dependent dehydrogenase (short-subunit alcohol dehydrogenase family)